MLSLEGAETMWIVNSIVKKVIKAKLGGDVDVDISDLRITSGPSSNKITVHIDGSLRVSKDDLVRMIFARK